MKAVFCRHLRRACGRSAGRRSNSQLSHQDAPHLQRQTVDRRPGSAFSIACKTSDTASFSRLIVAYSKLCYSKSAYIMPFSYRFYINALE